MLSGAVSWLSCDGDDADPEVFWRHVDDAIGEPGGEILDDLDPLEQAMSLLRALGRPGRPQLAPLSQDLVDPLSERERSVLRQLASPQDSREMANTMYLSVNTVRTHVKAIYRKLGVSSRADAVARGRELSLL